VHKNTIKLADFGLSKKADEVSDNSNDVLGLLPYIDPKYLNNVCIKNESSQLYLVNFKSDIYSVGVLFWQISSGRRPFYDEGISYDASLAMEIINGRREEMIEGTPDVYSNIYTGK
jgi:serine/threonine protein kinase